MCMIPFVMLLLAFSEDSGMAISLNNMMLLAFSEDSGMATDVQNILHDATTGLLGRLRHDH